MTDIKPSVTAGHANLHRVWVSACLLGERVRYDGGHKRCDDDILLRWQEEGRVVAFCPELAGGFPTPRPPAEIEHGAAGWQVLQAQARVVDVAGLDVSALFVAGAQAALRRVQALGLRVAVLKEGSPSCGTGHIYDGSFSGRTKPGQGVTAALLAAHGVWVFNETQLALAQARLHALDAKAAALPVAAASGPGAGPLCSP